VVGGTNRFHELVEEKYETIFGGFKTHLEYGRHSRKTLNRYAVDIIYFPYFNIVVGGSGFQFGSMTIGEVYEIEPVTKAFDANEGVAQALLYVELLKQNAINLKGDVQDARGMYQGQPYDWQYVRWKLGDSIPPTIYSLNLVPHPRKLIFWKQTTGLIVYIDTDDNNQIDELMTNSKYRTFRHLVAAEAPEAFDKYAEQLRAEATICYVGLDPMYWDSNYQDPWSLYLKQFLATYWKARAECLTSGACKFVFGP
jgi:hypothetical protein